MASADEEALIGRLCDAFSQNMKSGSDASTVRYDFAAARSSHVFYDESNPTEIKSEDKEVTRLQRIYLDVLKSNGKACERYQRLSAPRGDLSKSGLQPLVLKANSRIVLSYLESLRLQRWYQELDVRRHYAQSLSLDAPISCNLDIQAMELRNGGTSENFEAAQDEIATSSNEIKRLTTKLQKAVLQANHQLETQRALLASIRQQQKQQANKKPLPDKTHARPGAIAELRNVLIAWLEGKLSESCAAQDANMNNVPQERNGEPIPEPASVLEYYEKYISTRKTSLQAANEALRPFSTMANTDGDAGQVQGMEELAPTSEHLKVVQAMSQHLRSKKHQYIEAMAISDYRSTQMAKENDDFLEVIKRLADESHLLGSYPSDSPNDGDEFTRVKSAWTSAVRTAADSITRMIEQHERAGQHALENGEAELVQLKSYCSDCDAMSRTDHGINWRRIHGQLEDKEVT